MAEGTFEYECMRAELLGIDKPDYDAFLKKKEAETIQVEDEELGIENLKEAEAQSEELTATTGKLDELNNILAATQKKIDRFKFRCGSVTELIKTKIGNISGNGPTAEASSSETVVDAAISEEQTCENVEPRTCSQKQSELARALDNTNGKLDSMLDKAENAQYNMARQNQRIKKLLK